MTAIELKKIINAVNKTVYKSDTYFQAEKNVFEAKKLFLETHTMDELTEILIGKPTSFKLQNSKGNKYGNL